MTANGRETNASVINPGDYETRKREWIARQLENCPPLSERQKSVIRTAFAGHRAETQAGAA